MSNPSIPFFFGLFDGPETAQWRADEAAESDLLFRLDCMVRRWSEQYARETGNSQRDIMEIY